MGIAPGLVVDLVLTLAVLAVLGFVLRPRWSRPGPVRHRLRSERVDALRARIAVDPRSLGAYLDLFEILRLQGDRDAIVRLALAALPHHADDPAFALLRDHALFGFTLVPSAPTIGPSQTFERDPSTDSLRLRGGPLVVEDSIEVSSLDLDMEPQSNEHPGRDGRVFRIVSLDARLVEERVPMLITRLGLDTGEIEKLRVKLEPGEVVVEGQLHGFSFQIPFTIQPASDRLLLVRVPRAAQLLGLSVLPPSTAVGRVVTQLENRKPGSVASVGESAFLVDVTRFFPVPVVPNLTSVDIRRGELFLTCRQDGSPQLDPAAWSGPPVGTPSPRPANHWAAPPPHQSTLPAALPDSRSEMALARARGDLAAALSAGERAVEGAPEDDVLRIDVAELALQANEPARAFTIGRGVRVELGRSRLVTGAAMIRLGMRLEAVATLGGLETELDGHEDLLRLADRLLRGLGDPDAAAQALERLAGGNDHAPGVLGRAMALAWEARRPELVERLARTAIARDPFAPDSYKYLGLCWGTSRDALGAYTALTAAAWLDPKDRNSLKEAQTIRPTLEPRFSPLPGSAPATDRLAHPLDTGPLATLLRRIGPHATWLVTRAGPVEPPRPLLKVTRATHPVLCSLAGLAASALGVQVPEIVVDPRPGSEVALHTPTGTLRVPSTLLAELGREELLFSLGRAMWRAHRGDSLFSRLDRTRIRSLLVLLEALRLDLTVPTGRTTPLELLTRPFRSRPASPDRVDTDPLWNGLILPGLWTEWCALASRLPTPPTQTSLEEWIVSIELSADRAGLAVCCDLRAAIGATVYAVFGTKAILDEVRQRGLEWAIRFMGCTGLERRIRELLAHAVLSWHPDGR